MWFEESVFYQIYPLGFVGAPFENAPAEYTDQGVAVSCAKSTCPKGAADFSFDEDDLDFSEDY